MRRTSRIGAPSARNESAETWSAVSPSGHGDVGHRNMAMSHKDVRRNEAGWASALPRRNRRAVFSRDVGVLARVTEQHWSGAANRGIDCHSPIYFVLARRLKATSSCVARQFIASRKRFWGIFLPPGSCLLWARSPPQINGWSGPKPLFRKVRQSHSVHPPDREVQDRREAHPHQIRRQQTFGDP